MTITIQLTDAKEKKLQELAAAKGFANVADYVENLIEQEVRHTLDADKLEQEFRILADQWHEETKYSSIAKRMAEHPAYRKIVAMGPIAIPLILAEMERRPGHWFFALRELTGANPIPEASRGKLKEMTEAWLQWGREQGYRW